MTKRTSTGGHIQVAVKPRLVTIRISGFDKNMHSLVCRFSNFDFQNKQEGSTGHEWLGVTVYGEGRLHKRKTAQIYQNGSDKITLLYNLSFLVLMKSLKKEKYDFEENEWLALDIKYE